MSMLLTVQVTEEEGGVTLFCPELDLVTCSSTLGKARENFADLVEEYYLYLIDNDGQLDAESRVHLNLSENTTSDLERNGFSAFNPLLSKSVVVFRHI